MRVRTKLKNLNITYFVVPVLACLILPGLTTNEPASAQTAKPKAMKAEAKSLNKTSSPPKSKPQKSKRKKSRRATLVPPPPPTIPKVLSGGSLAMGSTIGLNYMSLEDLKWKEKTLRKELETLELDLEDSKRVLAQRLKQSANFESLYEEGVVSRRELERAQRGAKRLKREVERDSLRVAESKRIVEKVSERIKYLEDKKAKRNKTKKRRVKTKPKPSKKKRN